MDTNEIEQIITLVPAEKLRELSNENRVKRVSKQLGDIMQRMRDAALDGKYEIEVYYSIIPQVQDILRANHYNIAWRISSADASSTVISW